MSLFTLWLALGLGASAAKPVRGVGSGRNRTSSLVSCLLQHQRKLLRRRGFLHSVYVRSQSPHAHTKHIKYDAQLPFLQQASGFGGCMQKTVCHTLESLIIPCLVEVLPEFHLLPGDSCTRNIDINVKC